MGSNSLSNLVLSDLSPPLGDVDIDALGVDVDTEEWKAVFDSTNAAIANTYYDFVWPDGDKTMACIADDVADIYRDLKPALDAWNMQRDEYLPTSLGPGSYLTPDTGSGISTDYSAHYLQLCKQRIELAHFRPPAHYSPCRSTSTNSA